MQVRLSPEPVADSVRFLALRERRSVSQMASLLVEEALGRRPPIGSQDLAEALTERGVADSPEQTSPDEFSARARRDTDEGRVGLASRSLDVPRSVNAPAFASPPLETVEKGLGRDREIQPGKRTFTPDPKGKKR